MPTHVYIVKSGDFEITRRKRVRENKDNTDEKEVRTLIGPKHFEKSKKDTKLVFVVEKPQAFQEIRIATKSKGQILGFADVMAKRKLTTSCRCISNFGSLYVIKSEEFLAKMGKD